MTADHRSDWCNNGLHDCPRVLCRCTACGCAEKVGTPYFAGVSGAGKGSASGKIGAESGPATRQTSGARSATEEPT